MLGSDRVLLVSPEGRIEAVVSGEEAGEGIEYFPGMLSPGFINCHCHLDLSHLRNRIPERTGLVKFISHVMEERGKADEAEKQRAMEQAEKEMLEAGIVAVGDICSGDSSITVKKKAALRWHNFVEVTGFLVANADSRCRYAEELLSHFNSSLPSQTSVLSPHAPYSVSASLLRMINQKSSFGITSIHNQESEDEEIFFREGTGGFPGFYQRFNIDVSRFVPPGTSSFRYWYDCFDLPRHILSVHNTFTSDEDLDYLKENVKKDCRIIFCLCPAANIFIEGRLPPVGKFLSRGLSVVLGTDSLASNHQLSILEEMKILQKELKIPAVRLLHWATQSGAEALGLEREFGSFESGKIPGVIWLKQAHPGDIGKAEAVRLL